MNHLLQYLLQSSLCVAAFYLVYWCFLRRETFFMVNRFYLVSATLLSLLVPLIKFNLYSIGPVRSIVIYLDPVIITPERIGQVASQHWNILQTVWIVYITGVTVFLARFIFQLVQMAILVRRHEVIQKNGLNIVFMDQSYSPFSFFNYVFVNSGQDQDSGLSTIISHEEVHVRQRHSSDLMVMELLMIIQWFNPFAWFTGRSVKSIHEFLADEGVVKNGFSQWDYQELLLSRASGIQINNLTNNFNVSLLKKRMIMMTKTRSTLMARWKIIFALPTFLVVLFFFSTGSFDQIIAQSVKKEPQEQQVKNVAPVPDVKKTATGETVYTVAEKQPSFIGGQDGLVRFLMENIKYPEDAKKKGIQGKVFVTFVVMADGSVTDVNILRGIGSGCDEEALRVVKMMPKWNPGTQKGKPVNVEFNLPIKFKLDNKGEKKK